MGTALSHQAANGASPPLPAVDLDRRIRALERVVGELRERLRMLEEVLAPAIELPPGWGLSPSETIVFRALLARDLATKSQIGMALYDDDLGAATGNAVAVFIHHCRRKLRPFGVVITTEFAVGWRLQDRLRWKAKLG